MLGQGPVPVFIHGSIEYAAGVLLIVAPFLFSFDATAATAASVILGVALLAFTAMSRLPTGLIAAISVGVHVTVDAVFAVVLVAIPFLFGFTDEGAPTAMFITLGVVHLLVTIATRFPSRTAAEPDAG